MGALHATKSVGRGPKPKILSFFTPMSLAGMSWKIDVIFIGAGVLFGLLGGLISIGRYLKRDVGVVTL